MNYSANIGLPKLYYIHDPMCSWCWAFNPVWDDLTDRLSGQVLIKRVLGGLAPDTDQPMPKDLQQTIQNIWRTIQKTVPGTTFNFDFWKNCRPRRATHAACRAVIAVTKQLPELEAEMILSIQQAYYRDARNPSDNSVLIDLASALSLDSKRFAEDLDSSSTIEELDRQITFARKMGVRGFPSLVLENGGSGYQLLEIDYYDADRMQKQILTRDIQP